MKKNTLLSINLWIREALSKTVFAMSFPKFSVGNLYFLRPPIENFGGDILAHHLKKRVCHTSFCAHHDNVPIFGTRLILATLLLLTCSPSVPQGNSISKLNFLYALSKPYTASGITSFTPTSGLAGETVTITGTGFSTASTVKFNGTTATVSEATSTTLTVTIPTGAKSGKITVGTGTSSTDFTVNAWVTSSFVGSGTSGNVNGTGTGAFFNYPLGIAIDSSDNLYLAEPTNHLIRKITSAGVTTTFAGTGSSGNTDATGTAASFNGPQGISIDSSGNLYVGDDQNHKIRKITPGAVVTSLAGSGVAGNSDGTGTGAVFNSMTYTAADTSGNIYGADSNNNKIRKVTTAGGVVTTFAGSGVAGGTNSTGTGASFNGPYQIAIDSSGNLYVTEYINPRIRKITPVAVVTTFAGSGVSGSADGTGIAASFKEGMGIVVDSTGIIYVADSGNFKIRKITSAGVVTTIVGTGVSGNTDGIGTAAIIGKPHSIAIDSKGNIFVTDGTNFKIRKLTLTAQ